MAKMFCGSCGASNPATATECKKCHSADLRPKTADHPCPPPGVIGPFKGDLFDPKDESAPSAIPALPGTPLAPTGGDDAPDGDAEDFFSPRPPAGTFHVEVVAGADAGKSAELREDAPVLMGTAPSSDLELSDPFTSKKHASLTLRGGRIVLADEGSTNGTYLHVSDHWEIEDGTEILIGKTLVRVTSKV